MIALRKFNTNVDATKEKGNGMTTFQPNVNLGTMPRGLALQLQHLLVMKQWARQLLIAIQVETARVEKAGQERWPKMLLYFTISFQSAPGKRVFWFP